MYVEHMKNISKMNYIHIHTHTPVRIERAPKYFKPVISNGKQTNVQIYVQAESLLAVRSVGDMMEEMVGEVK